MKKLKLNNGVEIPSLGFGTWLIQGEDCYNAVRNALEIGYRHIDTAEAYENEVEVGKAIRESGINRKEIFLTTKLIAEAKDYTMAKDMIEGSLNKLDCEYIDLMIIHSPQPWKKVNQSSDRYFKGNLDAWKALSEFYKAGKIKAIGVSNFLEYDLKNIIENADIKPTVNQILCHISNTPMDLINYCNDNDIRVESYSPIGHGEILKNPIIVKMAEKYGVSASRLCIKYTLQLGTISLPKATSKDHIEDNFKMNFEITKEDMEVLKNVNKIENYGDSSFFPVYGGKM